MSNYATHPFTGHPETDLLKSSHSDFLSLVPLSCHFSMSRVGRLSLRRSHGLFAREPCSKTGKDMQLALMKSDQLIVVTRADEPVRGASKWDCHSIPDGGPWLHRAFSLFVFDSQGRLMVTRRSSDKLTYPCHWSNTVCSHPLYNTSELNPISTLTTDFQLSSEWPCFDPATHPECESGRPASAANSKSPFGTSNSITLAQPSVRGVARGAARRLLQEVGLPLAPASVSAHGRILYSAPNCAKDGSEEGIFAEAEIDYLLSAAATKRAAWYQHLKPTRAEVDGIVWVPPPIDSDAGRIVHTRVSNFGAHRERSGGDDGLGGHTDDTGHHEAMVEWVQCGCGGDDVPMTTTAAPKDWSGDAFRSVINEAIERINLSVGAVGGEKGNGEGSGPAAKRGGESEVVRREGSHVLRSVDEPVMLTPWFEWCVEDENLLRMVWADALALAKEPRLDTYEAVGMVRPLRSTAQFNVPE